MVTSYSCNRASVFIYSESNWFLHYYVTNSHFYCLLESSLLSSSRVRSAGFFLVQRLVIKPLRYRIGFKKLAHFFYPIKSKTKTNRDSFANVFPRFALAACFICQVLIGPLDCLCPL